MARLASVAPATAAQVHGGGDGSTRWRQVPRALEIALLAFASLATIFYVIRFWTVYVAGEIFHRLGFDWTMFYAQAMVVRTGDPSGLYQVPLMNAQLQGLAAYYTGGSVFQSALPVPYPPWFAAVIEPFTLPPGPVGFGLWLGLSLACAGVLAYRASQFMPDLPLIGALTLVLAAYPVAYCMFMGQVGMILAVAVSEMMISFMARRDFRAGLWLSVLLLKPQYAVLFGALIVWKWRLGAVAGAVVGGVALVVLGLVAAGPSALLQFPAALATMADFRNAVAGPWWMINWRAFVLYAMPGLENDQGAAVTLGLSAVTSLLLLYLWRGRWNPAAPEFAPRFAALAVGTLVTSYHSHVHGAPLMIVPLAAAWLGRAFRWETRLAILAALYVPTVMLMWVGGLLERFSVTADPGVSLWMVWPDAVPALLFVTAFLMIVRDVWNLNPPAIRLPVLTRRQPSASAGLP